MKNNIAIAMALALTCMASAPAWGKSAKRGVSENQFSLTVEMDAVKPGVCWYYNWGNTPNSGVDGQVEAYDGFGFVPMCWNANYNADKIRDYVKKHPDCKYLLGFNEPNFVQQANMTPAQAAEKWPAVQALAKELNLKLVAPALNYSPDAPYQDPCKWMDEFVSIVGTDAFDYTAIHVYGGYGVMTDLATKFHDKYGKEVWVTEFCYWPEAGNNNYGVKPAEQIGFMTQALEWLEKTPWIHKYAWFKAKGGYNSNKGPNYGLIIPQTGYDERKLSPQGLVYCYMSDFDKEVWNAVGTEFPAVDYIASKSVGLYPGNDANCAKPIEISAFNAGATVEWQFDVPAAGKYDLKLTVAGMGEPTRFDPQLKVQLVDGEEVTDLTDVVKMTLPNDDAKYEGRIINVTLPAGHVTLRLADAAPYQPSGIKISRVGLYAEGTGAVEGIAMDPDASVNVYNMQGVMLKHNVDPAAAIDGLTPGLYIIGNRKVLIK